MVFSLLQTVIWLDIHQQHTFHANQKVTIQQSPSLIATNMKWSTQRNCCWELHCTIVTDIKQNILHLDTKPESPMDAHFSWHSTNLNLVLPHSRIQSQIVYSHTENELSVTVTWNYAEALWHCPWRVIQSTNPQMHTHIHTHTHIYTHKCTKFTPDKPISVYSHSSASLRLEQNEEMCVSVMGVLNLEMSHAYI